MLFSKCRGGEDFALVCVRRYSFAVGQYGAAVDARSAVFALTGLSCRSKGAGTARFCAAELYVSATGCVQQFPFFPVFTT